MPQFKKKKKGYQFPNLENFECPDMKDFILFQNNVKVVSTKYFKTLYQIDIYRILFLNM